MAKATGRRYSRSRRSGFVLITVLVLAGSLLVLSGSGITRSLGEDRLTVHFIDSQQALYAAEAGLASAIQDSRHLLTITGQFPPVTGAPNALDQITPPTTLGSHVSFPGWDVDYIGAQQTVTISGGPYDGLRAQRRLVELTSSAKVNNVQSTLAEVVRLDVIPLFQFGMFDHDDFMLKPSTPMQFSGPVLTNGTLTLDPSATLTLNGTVTAAGEILHGGTNSAEVFIDQDANPTNGNHQDMTPVAGTWLQSTDANWAADSTARWNGRVKAQAAPLKVAVPVGENPIEMIKMGNPSTDSAALKRAKLYYQANVRIIDGVATNAGGTPISLPPGTITTTQTFYDAREGKDVCVTEIDVDKLMESQGGGNLFYIGSTIAPPSSSCFHAVRLINGEWLPNGGATFVTHHPLYVKGHFNRYDGLGHPAALIADSITALSRNWNDADSTLPTMSRAVTGAPGETVMRAGVMAGRARGGPGSEETMIRFLENWSTFPYVFIGSELSWWESEEASSNLACCGAGGAYAAPPWFWMFDQGFLTLDTLPPKTPVAYTVTSIGWSEQ